jgi:PAS domain S-box-containing protein
MLQELRVHQIELELQNEELRRSRLELEAARERYFDLFNLAPLGYFTLNEAGLILEANLYAASRLGVTRIALVHQPFTRFIFKDDQDSYYLHRRQLVEADLPLVLDLRMVRPDGVRFWAHLDAVTAREADGDAVLRITLGDISMQKLAEDRQRRLEAELQHAQSMESLTTLTGGIAHGMNNVLGAILGLATANLDLQPAGSSAHSAFEIITKAAERGAAMVRGLQSFTYRQSAEATKLDLNVLLQEGAYLLEHATFNKFTVTREFSAGLNPILGDAEAISSAFMSLFVNAVDAMPAGGDLTIRTRNMENHQVEVQVEDTGTGMPTETLRRALEPFFTTKEVGKGTGLGLSIVDSTIRAHRGHLEIHSEPGKGTLIRIRFPASGSQPSTPPPTREPAADRAWRPLTVLVVDDDDMILASMQVLLESLGHTTTPAASGAEALALLEAGLEAEVVTLDMNMPGLDGAETLLRIRALRPGLPILITTGRVDQSTLELSHHYPDIHLLSKPFSKTALDQQLQHLVRN